MNILNKILEKKCDIIGLQEAFWFNPKVESRFNMYNHVENDGGSNYYKSIVLFNKAKFTLLDNVKTNLHNRGVNVLKLKDNKNFPDSYIIENTRNEIKVIRVFDFIFFK